MVATGQLRQEDVNGALFAAELSLNGSLKAIKGAVATAQAGKQAGISDIYLPPDSAAQAALVEGVRVYAPPTLQALFLHLKGERRLPITKPAPVIDNTPDSPTFNDVIGHEQAKRALLIAAAGHHHTLLYGPPGTGKTLLASALPSLLPLSVVKRLPRLPIFTASPLLVLGW